MDIRKFEKTLQQKGLQQEDAVNTDLLWEKVACQSDGNLVT